MITDWIIFFTHVRFKHTNQKKMLMKNISTMNLDVLIARSQYLQELLLKLPDDQLCEVLISPRYEIVETMKVRLKAVYEGRRERQ